MLKENHYMIANWSEGYFHTNEKGNVTVQPDRKNHEGDLYELVKSLVEKGIEAPILIRFDGIVRDRIRTLSLAFRSAIETFEYKNRHQMAYPIKVNPQRHVVETVINEGDPFEVGLEVGSKPELIALLAMESNPKSVLLCNGYKDAEYITLALISLKMGRNTIIIIEQYYELALLLEIAKTLEVNAQIGIRMKLASRGSGRWVTSGGENAKFGLTTPELVDCLAQLKAQNKSDWLKLLHFHIGSQITTIESIKRALNEASRMYTEIAQNHPSLLYFDVGGGLAVDYDGTRSSADSSMNYTVEEYARDVVSVIQEACTKAKVKEPVIITETGRATVSHHSILVLEVIDVTKTSRVYDGLSPPTENPTLLALCEMSEELNESNCRETYHDLIEMKERLLDEFIYGKLDIKEKAFADKICSSLLVKMKRCFESLPTPPHEMASLEKSLVDTYFCNFSVFQSLPDSWAINQLFPVMPIHRLNEPAQNPAILADLSCDSDGKIDHFIDHERFIHLHDYNGSPYYIGIFLVGAYQEILGGLHNLFGDTNVVHAELEEGKWVSSRLVEGDKIEEVLGYMQYNVEYLLNNFHQILEKSVRAERISPKDAAQIKKKYKQSLESYTYLVV